MTPDETFKPMTEILRNFTPIGWHNEQGIRHLFPAWVVEQERWAALTPEEKEAERKAEIEKQKAEQRANELREQTIEVKIRGVLSDEDFEWYTNRLMAKYC